MTYNIRKRSIAVTVVAGVIGVTGIYVVCLKSYGSIANTINALQGMPLVADQYSKELKGFKDGVKTAVEFNISNISRRPMRLLGAKNSCSCMVVEELPRTLQPGETIKVKIVVTPTKQDTKFIGRISLYTSDKTHFVIPLEITGST